MKIFSQLVSAQLENRTSDYAAGTRARIWMRTDTSPVVVKFDNGSAIKTFADTDSSQTFTNKTWNGAVISEIYGGTNQSTYTTGDILYASAANTLAKLPKGANGQFLQIGASIPLWASVAATLGVISKSANYTIGATDDVILVDTGVAFTLTLPASTGGGKVYRVKKVTSDFNACTIARAGADTIRDVSASLTSTSVNTQGEEISIIDSSAGAWDIIDRRIPSVSTAFTPTGGWTTNTTYTGFYKRVGDSVRIEIKIALAGGTNLATLTVNLPTGLTIDTAKLAGADTDNRSLGIITILDFSGGNFTGVIGYNNTTSVGVFSCDDAAGGIVTSTVTDAAPIAFGAGDEIFLSYVVPITGWNG